MKKKIGRPAGAKNKANVVNEHSIVTLAVQLINTNNELNTVKAQLQRVAEFINTLMGDVNKANGKLETQLMQNSAKLSDLEKILVSLKTDSDLTKMVGTIATKPEDDFQ